MASAVTGDVSEEPMTRGTVAEPTRTRLVDHLDPRLVNALTVVGFGVPVIVYFWLLHRYSVNVIVSDQLSDLTVIGNSYTHLFDWSSLWAQHNENRILFPNLIVVLLAHTTNFNIQIEEYLSAAMLVATTFLLIWAHKRRSPGTPWLYYCPVALLGCSVVQYENTLWGFQMAWYLVLLSLATAVVLIDRVRLTWLVMTGAIVAAVIGSFSSLQGLLIWPAGLVLLYHRRRSTRFVVVWIGVAIASAVVYFYRFDTNAGSPRHGYALQHPLATVKFYIFAAGDIIGVPQHYYGPGNNAVLLLGIVILVMAALTLVVYGIRRDEEGGSPIGVALICVGLLFIATVTAGRVLFGYTAASQSRYTTYDLLIPIGIFLSLLEWPSAFKSRQPSMAESGIGSPTEVRPGERVRETMLLVTRWVLAAVIVVQVVLGFHYGLEGAKINYAYQQRSVEVTRNIDSTNNERVELFLDVLGPGASYIRHQVRIAQEHHLSTFSGTSDMSGVRRSR